MQPVRHERAATLPELLGRAALAGAGGPPAAARAQFLGGGTNLVDHMQLGIARPDVLLHLDGLADPALRRISAGPDGLRLGALVRMAELERHPDAGRNYPVIVETLREAASPQLRNMATLAGNLLQRTRCAYFRDPLWPCNRRQAGSGCAAMGGIDRRHAVLGTSGHCIAAYPGDLAQALLALDAVVEVAAPEGGRCLPLAALHRLPGSTPHIETVLRADEAIVAIRVPPVPWARRSRFVKVRDRAAFAFALASAAVVLDLDGAHVREARIALGGVATVPWRARPAEDLLCGARLDERAAEAAAEAAFLEARVGNRNAFKVELGKAVLVRALLEARDMQV